MRSAFVNSIISYPLTRYEIAIWYLGQSCFLFKTCSKYTKKYVLVDPCLTDYLDRSNDKKDVVWKRNYVSPIDPAELDFVDFVVCSHLHYDHCDPDTLRAIANSSSRNKFIVPKPIVDDLCSYDIPAGRIIPAIADIALRFGDISLLPVPAAHEDFSFDSFGDYKELGYVFQLNKLMIFHSGDTCIYKGLHNRIKRADVLLLPINGRSRERIARGINGNMNADEALSLANDVLPKLIIPMHYDLYDANGGNVNDFIALHDKSYPDVNYKVLKPGDFIVVTK